MVKKNKNKKNTTEPKVESNNHTNTINAQEHKEKNEKKKAAQQKKNCKGKDHSEQKVKKEESKELKDETFEQLKELQEKYIRLSAEFDNYRKRTLKEKAELLKTAGEETIIKILPVMDDFERAINSMDDAKDIEAVKNGINLIYLKFKEFLKQQGVSEIDAKEQEFNTDIHEAVTKIPAPNEDLKGKVVDVIEKGYVLNDKVIRYSKVVVGE